MSLHSKPLILVDGSSYLYRAFHGLPALMNSKGFPTGAVYGMLNMLRRLINDYQPEHMVVVFDPRGKTFRDDLFSEYKATRKEMPDDLAKQIEPIHLAIKALGLPIVVVQGIEADDIIGTLAVHATTLGMKTIVSTGDKDLAQLVNEHVSLINTMTNTLLTPHSVKEKFGVGPELIVDYLTLVGDSSDNIPGVPLVGPKTAVKWLQQYGSLDNLVAKAADMSGKAGENFRGFLPQLPLTRTLVTIKTDVSCPLNIEEFKLKPSDKKTLIEFYKEMEFKNWLSELLNETKESPLIQERYGQYTTILTQPALTEWVAKLNEASIFAFDTETTSIDYMKAEMVGISFAITSGEAVYIPFGHTYPGAPEQLSETSIFAQLKPILENPNIKKIAQNCKYDIEVFANHGIQLKGCLFDTMLESYVLDSVSNKHDLETLALKYLGLKTISYEEIAGKGSKQRCFSHVEIEKAAHYAAEDADITLQLHQTLWPKLAKESGLNHIFTNIEIPLVCVLARIERNGVLIDPLLLQQQEKELEQRLKELEQTAFTLAGSEFNLNSPKQLQEILFQRLKLPILQKTPTGQASTADGVLQELALDFELPRLIIEYRSLSKLISTYTSRLPLQINPHTQRIHTSYNQSGTATGRLSSSDPNLQNIPIRTQEGRRIRQAFIASPGYKLISADYSQIELRLMAHISQDPSLLNAFRNNLDIHQATAAEVAGVALEEVTSEMRRNAKAVNFGLIYGMSAFGLTRQLGIDRRAAQDYIDLYFARYPKVKEYMDNTRLQAKEKGYVETLWGRRLYLPDINASQIPRQKAAERTAINAPLQGSAADIIKMAMINIDQWLTAEKMTTRMIMQVHDELVFEAPIEEVERVTKAIQEHMINVATLSVPLQVSVGIGDNWDAASAH